MASPPAVRGEAFEKRDETLTLLEHLRIRAHRRSRAHYLSAKRASRMHQILGIPTVVLTAIVGTSIFAKISSEPSSQWSVVVGFISIISTLLVSLQTFFRFGEQSEKHRAAGAAFAAIKRQLDLLKVVIRAREVDSAEAHVKLNELIDRFSSLEAECLDIPDRFYDRARAEQERDQEGV